MEASAAPAPRRTSTSSSSSRAAHAGPSSSPSSSSSPVLSKATLARRSSQGQSTAPDLAAATSDISELLAASSSPDLRSLVEAAQDALHASKEEQRDVFLSHAPTLLSLHAELQHSIGALDSLSLFLTTFSNDLASVSHQISTLKDKSRSIEEHLAAKRALEQPLGALLDRGIVLDPKVVETIFDAEPDRTWADVVRQLENTLEATRRPLDQLAGVPASQPQRHRRTPSQPQAQPQPPDEAAFKALSEARQVAEACKLMVSRRAGRARCTIMLHH